MTWTLLDFVASAFEKNESLGGYCERHAPCDTAEVAAETFRRFIGEATALFGAQAEHHDKPPVELAVWPERLRIARCGRLLRVGVKFAPDSPYLTWHDLKWDGLDAEWKAISALLRPR